jgi:acetylornithine deacetylase/succinyl-diaminopimelate desuccinylase-like protein
MIDPQVKAHLDANRYRHVEELMKLIRYPSLSASPDHEADSVACAEHIAGYLRELGLEVELRPHRTRPVLLARWPGPVDSRRRVMLYGHYDVQPPDPLAEWESPPFEPVVRDGAIFGRGASDDKGQLFALICAVEAWVKARGRLPVDVLLFSEGEEEIGSPGMDDFLAANAGDLAVDDCIICDSDFVAPGVPTITYGLRGLVYVELTLTGPSADLHSGVHGGAVVNPLTALAEMVAAMRDDRGRITLPGFYDDVIELTARERRAWAELPFDERAYAEQVGAEPAGGEKDLPLLERRWARPTLDVHGVVGGHQGAGAKTVIPARATAKISMRLVADQRPERIIDGFRRFASEHTPAGVRAEVEVLSRARPVLVDPDSPAVAAASAALREAFGAETALVRNGASVPITEIFQRILHVDPVLMGLGLPGDRLHSPNEHFQLEQFHRGALATASLLQGLSGER